jgi:hypothetical protein
VCPYQLRSPKPRGLSAAGDKRCYRLYSEEGLALRRKRPWRHAMAVHREQRRQRPRAMTFGVWTWWPVSSRMGDGSAPLLCSISSRGNAWHSTWAKGLSGRDVVATLERLRCSP